jgi:site-specific recombinase XerC
MPNALATVQDAALASPRELALGWLDARPPASTSPVDVYLSSLSASSRRVMGGSLRVLARILLGPDATARDVPWWELRYQHAAALRAHLAERYAPATANRHLSALRGVLQESWRLGLMDSEAFRRAADVRSVSGSRLPAGRDLDAGEIRALLEVCAKDDSPAGRRDAALVALGYGCGLRIAELAALELDAIEGRAAQLVGKGEKERRVYMPAGAAAALDEWLAVRGREAGPIFVAISRTGEVSRAGVSAHALRKRLERRREQAGLPSCSPHDLRRSWIGAMLDSGADLSTVQTLAGHADPATTARYDRRPERVRAAASERLHVPFVAHGG